VTGSVVQGLWGAAAACVACGLHHAEGAPCPVAAALSIPAPNHVLPSGTLVGGRFELEVVTNHSGMSTLYRAVDRREQFGTVAVKQLSIGGLSPEEQEEARSWLAREAGLLSSLKNPHLPELLAAFSEGDNHFLVMPYLVGKTIKDRVESEGPLPELDVMRWARTLATVLAYLHSQDPPIIHRDLKPSNILVLPDNRLILLDLGVARPLSRGTVGTAIGTPGYAPPEQYQGLADEWSDLYALGATMHYMLTGYDADQRKPFRHPPVHTLRPDINPAVNDLVMALLEIAPADRPLSAGIVGSHIDMMPILAVRQQYERAIRRYLVVGSPLVALTGLLSLLAATAGLAAPGSLVPAAALVALVFLWGGPVTRLLNLPTIFAWQPGPTQVGAAAHHDETIRLALLRAGNMGSDGAALNQDALVVRARKRIYWALKIPLTLSLLLLAASPLAYAWMVMLPWLLFLIPLVLGWRSAVQSSSRQQRVLEDAGTGTLEKLGR
jgi:hypothetical protein